MHAALILRLFISPFCQYFTESGYIESPETHNSGVQWLAKVESAAQGFVFEHAAQLAEELLAFIRSGLTVAGHDRTVFGEASLLTTDGASGSADSEQQVGGAATIDMVSESSTSRDGEREEGELSEVVEEEEHMLSLSISSGAGLETASASSQPAKGLPCLSRAKLFSCACISRLSRVSFNIFEM